MKDPEQRRISQFYFLSELTVFKNCAHSEDIIFIVHVWRYRWTVKISVFGTREILVFHQYLYLCITFGRHLCGIKEHYWNSDSYLCISCCCHGKKPPHSCFWLLCTLLSPCQVVLCCRLVSLWWTPQQHRNSHFSLSLWSLENEKMWTKYHLSNPENVIYIHILIYVQNKLV